MRNKLGHRIFGFLIVLLLVSCGGKSWKENPMDQILEDHKDAHTLTVLLVDMDVRDDEYLHKYKIIEGKKNDQEPDVFETDWVKVSEPFFIRHEQNLGMEILTKDADGKINQIPSPPGYTNYIGNSKYGEWRGEGENRQWHFFANYLYMRTMLNFVYGPVYYRGYSRYSSHYRYNRPYYGYYRTSSRYNQYGTRSKHLKKSRPNFYQRKARKGNFRTRYNNYSTGGGGSRGGGGYGK